MQDKESKKSVPILIIPHIDKSYFRKEPASLLIRQQKSWTMLKKNEEAHYLDCKSTIRSHFNDTCICL